MITALYLATAFLVTVLGLGAAWLAGATGSAMGLVVLLGSVVVLVAIAGALARHTTR